MEDFLHSPADWEDNMNAETIEMVAAKNDEFGYAVFTYGDGGLEAYK